MVGVLLLTLTAIITFPLILRFNSILPGTRDTFIYLWTLWWFAYSLLSLHQIPLYTDLLFYPTPINIAQDVSLIHGLIAMPITHLFGPIAGYNFVIFFTFIITGLGFFLFLRLLTKHTWAACIGSVIFTFSYYRIFRALIGHLDLASTEWYGFALYFLSLLFIYRKHERKNFFGAAGFMALTAYTEYRSFSYFLIFSGVFFAVSVFVHLTVDRTKKVTTQLFEGVIAYAHTLVLLFIFIIPLIAVNITKTYDVQFAPTYPEFNAPPIAFIAPPCSIIVSQLLPGCYTSKSWEGNIVYLGIIPMLLSAILFFRKKTAQEKIYLLLFAIIFIVFVLFAMGTSTPLFSWLFYHISLFRIMRVPSRFVVIAEISMAVFAAFATKHLLDSIHGKTKKGIIMVGLLFLLTVEALPLNLPVVDTEKIPDEHLPVLRQSHNYAVLEIPFGFRGNIYETIGSHFNDISFYYQIRHRIPLIGGYMSMIDKDTWIKARRNQLIQKMALCQKTKQCDELDDGDREQFSHVFRIRYVIFHDDQHKALERYLVDGFGLIPLYQKGSVAVWENPAIGMQ